VLRAFVLRRKESNFTRKKCLSGHHKKNQYGSFHESYEKGREEGRYEKGDEEVRQEVQEIIFQFAPA
jgi:hypothetical protein